MSKEMEKTSFIWMDGKLIPWDEAKMHVMSHVIHYGSGEFSGARCYQNPNGSAIFRLRDHARRLIESCTIYGMEIPYTKEDIAEAMVATVEANKIPECYIRPILYRGYHSLGVDSRNCPVNMAIGILKWDKYIGDYADVCVSSWQRPAPNTFPAMAKSTANYANSQLIKHEAGRLGLNEGIALTVFGHISEGSGENIFVLYDGILRTPPLSDSVLNGIMRRTVLQLAKDLSEELKIEVREESVPRELLYIADEVFFTGSAAEITPIRKIDHVERIVPGPVTKRLQNEVFGIIRGEKEDRYHWLTYVKM